MTQASLFTECEYALKTMGYAARRTPMPRRLTGIALRMKSLGRISAPIRRSSSPYMQPSHALKVIAAFEALKGLVALAAASGVLLLVHRDLHQLALHLVEHTHLNPAAKYPSIFIEAASRLQDSNVAFIAAGSAAYSIVRFVESYGLFRGAAWAEAFAALSGAVYVPFELAAIVRKPNWLGFVILVVNLAVVAVVVVALLHKHRARKQNAA